MASLNWYNDTNTCKARVGVALTVAGAGGVEAAVAVGGVAAVASAAVAAAPAAATYVGSKGGGANTGWIGDGVSVLRDITDC